MLRKKHVAHTLFTHLYTCEKKQLKLCVECTIFSFYTCQYVCKKPIEVAH